MIHCYKAKEAELRIEEFPGMNYYTLTNLSLPSCWSYFTTDAAEMKNEFQIKIKFVLREEIVRTQRSFQMVHASG